MSEFRKPYEYEEDTGVAGFLMVFFVMLLTVELLLAAAMLVQGYAILGNEPRFRPVVLALGIGYIALTLVVCIALRKMWRRAIGLSKILLIARVLLLGPAYGLLYGSFSRIRGIRSGFRSELDMVLVALVVPLVYILGFSGLWYAYFSRSRRVRRFAETANARKGGRASSYPV